MPGMETAHFSRERQFLCRPQLLALWPGHMFSPTKAVIAAGLLIVLER